MVTYDPSSLQLLAQVPLTVSPFVSLPTATTLPYTYKPLPSSLPPSSTADQTGDTSAERPKFVVSSSGQVAHPDEILASCQRLRSHLDGLAQEAQRAITQWEHDIKERELAEKRRVAPGWLDRNERILQPSSVSTSSYLLSNRQNTSNVSDDAHSASNREAEQDSKGEELDRAFGSMTMNS